MLEKEAVRLEENRLKNIGSIEDYESLHERHRIFPAVFEARGHRRILDVSAGVGIVAKRIKDFYGGAELVCNDISPTCLRIMRRLGLESTAFDIDDDEKPFPFPDGHFDAVISLATIEHLMHAEHFLREINRLLKDGGCLYISAPNYTGLPYLMPFLFSGKTFHDPMKEASRYEFHAHVKYFTYNTLLEYVGSFGFAPEAVYLALPEGSSRYLRLKSRSGLMAFAFRHSMRLMYRLLSPRWAAEPVLCFRKGGQWKAPRKVVL